MKQGMVASEHADQYSTLMLPKWGQCLEVIAYGKMIDKQRLCQELPLSAQGWAAVEKSPEARHDDIESRLAVGFHHISQGHGSMLSH